MEQYEDEIMEVAIYFLSILAKPESEISDYLADVGPDGTLVIGMEDDWAEDGKNSPCLPFEIFCWTPIHSPSFLAFLDLPYFESLSQKEQKNCESLATRLGENLSAIAWSGDLLVYEEIQTSGETFERNLATFTSIQFEDTEVSGLMDSNDVKDELLNHNFSPFSKGAFFCERCWDQVREVSNELLKSLKFSPQKPGMSIQEMCKLLMPG